MARIKKPKLEVELVPSTCHFSNVRTTVKPTEWDKIRLISYEAAGNVCEICGDTGKNQGYKHNVECHEIWDYDNEKLIQTLVGLISLCPTCHQVKHIGRAIAIGKQYQAFAQLAKVNKWTKAQVVEHVAEAFLVYSERSKYQWALDLSLLKKEPYSIALKENAERIFIVKKYKKKKKKRATVKKKKVGKRPPKSKQ